jgi:ABC-type antimicrobial peptide transport system permease subunit
MATTHAATSRQGSVKAATLRGSIRDPGYRCTPPRRLVEQRTKEIGVRMALGASSQTVARLMLAHTARPVIYGLIAGAVLAATLATVLLATEFGTFIAEIVHVTDPAAYAISLLVVVTACLLAAWIPATRAARLDPMQTLRQE